MEMESAFALWRQSHDFVPIFSLNSPEWSLSLSRLCWKKKEILIWVATIGFGRESSKISNDCHNRVGDTPDEWRGLACFLTKIPVVYHVKSIQTQRLRKSVNHHVMRMIVAYIYEHTHHAMGYQVMRAYGFSFHTKTEGDDWGTIPLKALSQSVVYYLLFQGRKTLILFHKIIIFCFS